jgi:hypothetical protein
VTNFSSPRNMFRGPLKTSAQMTRACCLGGKRGEKHSICSGSKFPKLMTMSSNSRFIYFEMKCGGLNGDNYMFKVLILLDVNVYPNSVTERTCKHPASICLTWKQYLS